MEYIKYLFNENAPQSFNSICLSAGSSKGIYQLGALHYLDSINKFSPINTFIGSSIGAVISCLLSCGYKPLELLTLICCDDLNNVLIHNIGLKQIFLEWGAISNKLLKEYIEKAIIDKLSYIPTFEDLYIHFGIIFICSAWCLTSSNHKVYFNYLDTPNVLISDAALASSSLPGVFTKMQIDDHYYLDGGLFDYCPLQFLLDFSEKYLYNNSITVMYTKSPNDNNPIIISSLIDYIKEIAYIPFYMQPIIIDINTISIKYKNIKYIELNCNCDDVTLNVSVKDKIIYFCDGYDQTKQKYYII